MDMSAMQNVRVILHNELADHGIASDDVPSHLREWIRAIAGHFERGVSRSQIFDAWRSESELLFVKACDAIENDHDDGDDAFKGERKVDYLNYVYTSWMRVVRVYRIR